MTISSISPYLCLMLAQCLLGCQAPNISAQERSDLSFSPQLLLKDNNEACTLMDVNQDGLLDVVAGRMWYAAPDFIPSPVRPIALHGQDYAQNNGEYSWDVDQDGWPDIVATGWEDPHIRWYKNPGPEILKKGLEWTGKPLADTKNTRSEAGYMVDLDGDGVPEYIMNSWDKSLPFSIWRLDQNVFGEPVMTGSIIGSHNSHGVGFGDVNGDGRTDVLFDQGWYEQPAEDIWAGNWRLHADWQLDRSSCPMQVVDLNGDGRNDIIWGKGHDYGLFWEEQGVPIGDSTTWTRHVIDESWSQVHAMIWTDLDGDGQGELLTGKRIYAHSGKDPGAEDPAHIFRYVWNAEKQRFRKEALTEGPIGTGLFIRVADLNADNKADIVVAGKTGTYILWQK
ncbi:MAG: VCBS repeat-containing protein [Bacteroidota bacterium]